MIDFEEIMAECLALMEAAGLKLYGRKPSKLMVKAYLSVIHSFGVADEDLIRRASITFCQDDGDFPSAARFARRCLDARNAGMVAIGVPCEDGETIRIELRPEGSERMSVPRPAIEPTEIFRPLAPRELPAPMAEDETAAERRRQLDALRGDK